MASEAITSPYQTEPLDKRVADLTLQEKTGVVAGEAHASVDVVEEGAKDSAEGGSDSNERQKQVFQDSDLQEVNIAKIEAQKSSNEAYVVQALEHRTIQVPGGEKKVEVPTGIVHENADPVDEPNQTYKDSQEVNIAQKEVGKNADEGAYVVQAVDHRSIQEPGSEEKVEVPTGVVHENADPVDDKSQQQGKGLIQSITQSVRSVFSGLTGSKAAKESEVKIERTTE